MSARFKEPGVGESEGAGSRTRPETLVQLDGGPIARVLAAPGPVIAVALHAGHLVRPSLLSDMSLAEDERLREEDPFTTEFAPRGVQLVAAERSRFEVDLNRPRDKAVYRTPQDAWGLHVWRTPPDEAAVQASLAVYDACYDLLRQAIATALDTHSRVLVLDLHSYNHRREGTAAAPASIAENPDVNLGTARIDRERWAGVCDAFLTSMRESGFDARENVKFGGGHFAEWVSTSFDDRACVLSIEFKKTFMDEWTGEPDTTAIERRREALEAALPPMIAALGVSDR